MNWAEFAKKIDGQFEESLSNFVGGDTIARTITKERTEERISIQKIIRRAYDSSSHTVLREILPLAELKYLLQHPKSEFILLQNSITFKSQSIGMMNEDLEQIFHAIEVLKDKLKML